jgi:hypothetical protein
MSKEIRNSMFGISGGSTGGGVPTLTPELIAKMSGWWNTGSAQTGYYIDQLRSTAQEREALTDGGIAGVEQPGRGISYDGTKSQYSKIQVEPENFKIGNNSLTYFCKFKMASAPAAATLIMGSIAASNGNALLIITSAGKAQIRLYDSVGYSNVLGANNICDGFWHTIFVLIDKAGYLRLYIDNVLQAGSVDISALSFATLGSTIFYVGGATGYFVGTKVLRDVRLFASAITADSDRLALQNGEYVAGVTSWWMFNLGKASLIYDIQDCVGVNHLQNVAFDGTELVTGAWTTLLNKYGYSPSLYESTDLILGQGNFSNAAEWTTSAARWTIASGYARFLAAGDYQCINKVVLSYPAGTVLEVSFDVDENTADIMFVGAGATALNVRATYAIGSHTVIFRALNAITLFGMYGYGASAFRIDNLIVKVYDAGLKPPLMSSATPATDIFSRSLVFTGQAKYNLVRVSPGVVKMTDYLGELFNATELVTVNDWYNASGVAQNINWADIDYEFSRQYVGAKKLIIINENATLTAGEDALLKRYVNF